MDAINSLIDLKDLDEDIETLKLDFIEPEDGLDPHMIELIFKSVETSDKHFADCKVLCKSIELILADLVSKKDHFPTEEDLKARIAKTALFIGAVKIQIRIFDKTEENSKNTKESLQTNLKNMKNEHDKFIESITGAIKSAEEFKFTFATKLKFMTKELNSKSNPAKIIKDVLEAGKTLVKCVTDLKDCFVKIKIQYTQFGRARAASAIYLNGLKERQKSMSTKADYDAVMKFLKQ